MSLLRKFPAHNYGGAMGVYIYHTGLLDSPLTLALVHMLRFIVVIVQFLCVHDDDDQTVPDSKQDKYPVSGQQLAVTMFGLHACAENEHVSVFQYFSIHMFSLEGSNC